MNRHNYVCSLTLDLCQPFMFSPTPLVFSVSRQKPCSEQDHTGNAGRRKRTIKGSSASTLVQVRDLLKKSEKRMRDALEQRETGWKKIHQSSRYLHKTASQIYKNIPRSKRAFLFQSGRRHYS